MDKLFTTLVPIFLVLAFSVAITQTVRADTETNHSGFSSLEAIEIKDLADLNGRDNLTNVQSIQELDASVSNSTFNADTITSGAITIEQHALDHFEGVGMFNIFTGNNNAVDSAVGISVYVTE